MVQMVILNGALVALTLYCSYLVSEERVLTVGDFVLLGTYFMQLMTPLNYIGTLYRIIQESFVNMENMFDLMNEEVTSNVVSFVTLLLPRWMCKTCLTAFLTRRQIGLQPLNSSPATSTTPIASLC